MNGEYRSSGFRGGRGGRGGGRGGWRGGGGRGGRGGNRGGRGVERRGGNREGSSSQLSDKFFHQALKTDNGFANQKLMKKFVNSAIFVGNSDIELAVRRLGSSSGLLRVKEVCGEKQSFSCHVGDRMAWPISFERVVLPLIYLLTGRGAQSILFQEDLKQLFATIYELEGFNKGLLRCVRHLAGSSTGVADPNYSCQTDDSIAGNFIPAATTDVLFPVASFYLFCLQRIDGVLEDNKTIQCVTEFVELGSAWLDRDAAGAGVRTLPAAPSSGQLLNIPTSANPDVSATRRKMEQLLIVMKLFHHPLLGQLATSGATPSSLPFSSSSVDPEACGPGPLRAEGVPRHNNDAVGIRDISIYPTVDEALCLDDPYLPRNLPGASHHLPVGGDRLLDLHFRLLRQDLIQPINECAQVFEACGGVGPNPNLNGSRFRVRDAKTDVSAFAARNVQVVGIEPAGRRDADALSFCVTFDNPPGLDQASFGTRVGYWERSKVLSRGALVLIWWEQQGVGGGGGHGSKRRLAFATITQRDEKVMAGRWGDKETPEDDSETSVDPNRKPSRPPLKPPLIGLSFCDKSALSPEVLNVLLMGRGDRRAAGVSEIVMLEVGSGYWSVQPVLRALQDLTLGELPFCEYLCVGQKGGAEAGAGGDGPLTFLRGSARSNVKGVGLPKYLTPTSRYDFSCLAKPGTSPRELETLRGVLFTADQFPTRLLQSHTTLDVAQLDALRAALTEEMCIMQGPPGTGKTYVGTRIVDVLLRNNAFLGPILCVCYTNHALDQFLEAIRQTGVGVDRPGDLIRIGGNCKSEVLKAHNLRDLARERRKLSPRLRGPRLPGGGVGIIREEERDLVHNVTALGEVLLADKLSWDVVKEVVAAEAPALFDSVERHMRGRKTETSEDGWTLVLGKKSIWQMYFDPPGMTMKAVQKLKRDRITEWKKKLRHKRAEKALETHAGRVGNAFQVLGEGGNDVGGGASSGVKGKLGNGGMAEDTGTPAVDEEEKPDRKPCEIPLFWYPLSESQQPTPRDLGVLLALDRPWVTTRSERKIVYAHFQKKVRDEALAEVMEAGEELRRVQKQRVEIEEWDDLALLREAKIVGMTTSGAAIQQNKIRALGPRVVVVEEAAEVLEAHILTSLTPSTQHLILIGDHEQLRPKAEVRSLQLESGCNYNLDLSLFERLVVGHAEQEQEKGGGGGGASSTDSVASLGVRTLSTQRRMRPAISSLIKSIYPNLRDAVDVVGRYPPVRGMARDLLFFDHDHPEGVGGNAVAQGGTKKKRGAKGGGEESRSKYNEFEVGMVVAFTRYMLRQGYASGQITVLTPYLGQLMRLREAMSQVMMVFVSDRDEEDVAKLRAGADLTGELGGVEPLQNPQGGGQRAKRKGRQGQKKESEGVVSGPVETKSMRDAVRIATIDNFQGEESEVIIVSLVRNQPSGRIGFLSTSNRVNVLLSRAKHGMYLFGHAASLRSSALGGKRHYAGIGRVPGEIWTDVLDQLEEGGSVVTALPLQCQLHPDTLAHVSEPCGFDEHASEGGCQRLCDGKLPCTHACEKRCHPDDREHLSVRCLRPCERVRPFQECPSQHPCPLRCSDACGPCREPIPLVMLPCGHEPSNVPCHLAQNPSELECSVMVQVKIDHCGHVSRFPCSRAGAVTPLDCPVVCGERAAGGVCTHKCQRACGKCLRETMRISGDEGGAEQQPHYPVRAVHSLCKVLCGSMLSCGHRCQTRCLKHPGQGSGRGLPPTGCCPPCVRCTRGCEHQGVCEKSPGGLESEMPCTCRPCDLRCGKLLACGHRCPSVCGEPCPTPKYCTEAGCYPANVLHVELERVRNQVVDASEGKTFGEWDPNESPLLVLGCGHVLTMKMLDRLVGLKKTGYSQQSPSLCCECPQCGEKVTGVRRYGWAELHLGLVVGTTTPL